MIKVVESEPGNVRVEGEATIHEAVSLWESLRDACSGRNELVLDLGGLTEIDTAGAQVLLAARKSIPAMQVHSCPVRMREFLELVGLAAQIL